MCNMFLRGREPKLSGYEKTVYTPIILLITILACSRTVQEPPAAQDYYKYTEEGLFVGSLLIREDKIVRVQYNGDIEDSVLG